MKIAASSGKPSKKADLIIPLYQNEKESNKLSKDNSITWELYTIPTDNTSPKYKHFVRILEGDETVRQQISWRTDVIKACVGLNATTLESRRPIMEACMRTRPLTLFLESLQFQAQAGYNEALKTALEADDAAGNNNASTVIRNNGVDHYRANAHLDRALQVVLLNLMPSKVLPKVKRQMRREMRKPLDMKVRAYAQHLVRLNQSDLPNLPPFHQNQALTQDELLDILLFGTPRSWQNEMDRQGFDPIEKGFYPTVDFMENMEGLEDKPAASTMTKPTPKDKSKSKNQDNESAKKKATHYCQRHGPNYTHDTADCRALKGKDKDGKFSNKTWTRKADESNSKSKKELAVLLAKSVEKQVKAGVKKQLAALQKKRKADDSDEEGECHLAD